MNNEIEVIKQETTDLVTQAKAFAITTQVQYDSTAGFLKSIKALQKKISNCFDPIVAAALKTHREAVAKRKEHLDPAIRAEKIVKEKLLDYDERQEAIRREQQAKLERQAEAERAKKEEQERKWREQEDAKRREAERLAAEGKVEEARKAQEAADKAAVRAEERQEAAERVVTPVVAPRAETPKGISYRENWYAEVVDKKLIPLQYLEPNMPMLNRMAKAMKDQATIPGVQFKFEKIASARNV